MYAMQELLVAVTALLFAGVHSIPLHSSEAQGLLKGANTEGGNAGIMLEGLGTEDSIEMRKPSEAKHTAGEELYPERHTRSTSKPAVCVDYLYILAFTSGLGNAQTAERHEVELRAASQTRHIVLPDRPVGDYTPKKGDLWKIPISDFGFSLPGQCILLTDVKEIAITERSNDGWNIESIVTFLRSGDSTHDFHLASVDIDVFRWIDGDGTHAHRRFELTLAI